MRVNIPMLVTVFLMLASRLTADQVTLKNGDRVSGSIVKSDRESLIVTTEFMGKVSIQWDSIEQLSSDQPLFVTSSDGQVLTGRISTGNGRFQVMTAERGRLPVSKAVVESIRSQEEQRAYEAEMERLRNPSLLDFWGGYVDAGLSFTQGNSDTTTLTFSTRTERKTPRNKISIYSTSLFARNSTSGVAETTANAIRGGTRYDVDLSRNLFTFGFIDLEFDEFQRLDFRNALGGGLGWHMRNTDRIVFDVFGGGAFNQEFFHDNVTRRSAEALIGQELSYQLLKEIDFSERIAFFPNLSDGGEYRLQFDASLSTELSQWFAWHITLSDRFLTDPLPGVKKNDVLLSTGVRFSFGPGRE